MRALVLAILLAAGPALAQDGSQLFALQCKMCHNGVSTQLAPPLTGVAPFRRPHDLTAARSIQA